jgi:probable rRNA maturation factor
MKAQHDVWIDLLTDDAQRVLAAVGRPGAEVSISLMGDPEIQRLNRSWRGIDSPTDVLSFPQMGSVEGPVDVLGDVVISVQTAERQALEIGHPLIDELRVLLVHGLAHLLGHDHDEPGRAADMSRLEREMLAVLEQETVGLVGRAMGPDIDTALR